MDLYTRVPLLPLGTPSIRLLEPHLVHQSEYAVRHRHSSIHGSLTTYALGETPAYQALSYTWGDQTERKVAMMNGFKCAISSNVHEALLHLLPKAERGEGTTQMRIWVDGISINQYDNAEKSSQVSKMREIYAQAESCLVWLGKAHVTTQLAFDTLERFARDDSTWDGGNICAELAKDQDERVAAIEEILRRPWFTRIWVLQEIVVATKVVVHCGVHEIEWHQLTSGIKKAVGSHAGFLKFPISHPPIGRVVKMADWRWAFHQKCEEAHDRDAALDLKVIIMDGGEKNATDMRDKVFALRGIASATFSDGIIVRYEKPVEDVYIDCAKFLLRTRSDLRLLSLVRQGQKKKSGLILPSWVPDWSQEMDGGGVLQRYFRFKPEKYFRAALTTVPKLRLPADNNNIVISGHRLGAVKLVRGINGLLKDLEHGTISISKSTLERVATELLSSEEAYGSSREAAWMALFRTITADRSPLSERIDDEYRMKFNNFKRQAPDIQEGPGISEQELLRPDLNSAVRDIVDGKAVFVTDGGLLGFTEEGCRVGDVVCVFLGGEVPFIIRQHSFRPLFQLHGEAYVHGVMDGEGLRAKIDTCAQEQEFIIR